MKVSSWAQKTGSVNCSSGKEGERARFVWFSSGVTGIDLNYMSSGTAKEHK